LASASQHGAQRAPGRLAVHDRSRFHRRHARLRAARGRPPVTWITPDFERSYTELHRRGLAHSVEVWSGTDLVGGLYGVTLGGFFGGESMFHRATDASKAAVGFLIERLRAGGFSLCDAQVPTPHLARLGAINISRADYLGRLRRALAATARLTGS